MFLDKVSGAFELIVRDAETGDAKRCLRFDNLILNSGLNGYFEAKFGTFTYCAVGNGTSTPSPTDVALSSPVAYSSTYGAWTGIAPVAPDYVMEARSSYRFNAGTINGNITEIGVCATQTSANNTFWCRALILDEHGQPTSLTVLSNEYLDVVYVLRLHPDLEDKSFDLIIDGETHHCVSRPAFATNPFVGSPLSYTNDIVTRAFSTQTLGEITSQPSDQQYNGPNNATKLPYQSNSYRIQCQSLWGLTQGNISGGIGSVVVLPAVTVNGMRNSIQVSFTPKIPKDNTIELRFTTERRLSRL